MCTTLVITVEDRLHTTSTIVASRLRDTTLSLHRRECQASPVLDLQDNHHRGAGLCQSGLEAVGVVAQRPSSWNTDAKRLPTVCHCSTTTGDPFHGLAGLTGVLGLQGLQGLALAGLCGPATFPVRTCADAQLPGVASWKMPAKPRETAFHCSRWMGEARGRLGEADKAKAGSTGQEVPNNSAEAAACSL